jgi:type IV secretion system protein VirB10
MDLSTKYPKVVLARKWIIVGIGGFLIVIALIVITNIYRGRAPQSQSVIKAPTQTTAGTYDWRRSLKKEADPLYTGTLELPANGISNDTVALMTPVPKDEKESAEKFEISEAERQKKEMDEAFYQQAMNASITSNQLSGGSESSNTSVVTSAVQTSASSFGANEPEMVDASAQNQKKAFLKENAVPEGNNYLHSTLNNPISPYEIKEGTIIPSVLLTGINSDLPGQITARIRSNVYDSLVGTHVLIPQGSTLIGLYDSVITYGQRRLLVVWKRIIFPNGKSINLEGMPGTDLSGYAGFHDKVNNHYSKIFGSVVLLSVLSAGAQLSQPQQSQNEFEAPSVNQILAQSLGTNIAETATAMTQKNLNIQPTLEIRPGYLFNITVTKDMVFPSPYSPEVVIGSQR